MRLWNVATGQVRATLKGHSAAVTSVAFSVDDEFLVTGSEDGTVKLWDLRPVSGPVSANLQGLTSSSRSSR